MDRLEMHKFAKITMDVFQPNTQERSKKHTVTPTLDQARQSATPSINDILASWRKRDSFQRDIAKKTQLNLFRQQEAEVEATLDRLIRMTDNKDNALLYVVSKLFVESTESRESEVGWYSMTYNKENHLGAGC